MTKINPYLTQRHENGKTGRIWLQNYGFAEAVIASELQVGDQMIWNYGTVSTVDEIKDVGKQTLTIREKFEKRGGSIQYYERRARKTRLIAVTHEVYERVAGGNHV